MDRCSRKNKSSIAFFKDGTALVWLDLIPVQHQASRSDENVSVMLWIARSGPPTREINEKQMSRQRSDPWPLLNKTFTLAQPCINTINLYLITQEPVCRVIHVSRTSCPFPLA